MAGGRAAYAENRNRGGLDKGVSLCYTLQERKAMKTALIVDNSRLLRTYLKELLQAEGFEKILEASSAKEAIAALKERKPYLFASGEKREEKAPEGREQPPPGGKTEGKDAFSMSDAEFDLAFRKQFPRV